MKFIGNQIYQWISRFRNDVYLEDLSTSTEQSYLVVDSEGKITKRTTLNSGSNDITTTGDINSTNVIITGEIRGPATTVIDPAPVGDNNGVLQIKGDLQVDGTTTTINSTTLTVDDKNIVLSSGSTTSLASDGSGITIDGASATLTYTHSDTSWNFNKNLNIDGPALVAGTTLNINNNYGESNKSITFTHNNGVTEVAKICAYGRANNAIPPYFLIKVNNTVSGGSNSTSSSDRFKIQSDGTFMFNTVGGDEKVRITSDGSVGIGTDSPSQLIDVASSGVDTNAPTIRITNTANNNASNWSGKTSHAIEFHSTDPSRVGLASSIKNIAGTDKGGVLTGNITFNTADWPTGGIAERMRITDSGFVGIGITNPANPLSVQSASNTVARFTSTDNRGNILIEDDDTSGYVVAEGGTLGFGFSASQSANNINVDSSNNNVGIGTVSPTHKLEVREGDVHFENTSSSNTFVDAKGSSANAYFRAFSDSNSVWLYQGGTSSYLSAQSGSTLRINSGTTSLILSDNSSEVLSFSSGIANFTGRIAIQGTTDEALQLKVTDDGPVYHSYYRGTDRHAYVGFGSSNDVFSIANEESGGSVRILSGGSLALNIASDQTATFEGTVKSKGTLSIENTFPQIALTDTNHDDDWRIRNNNGHFEIYNETDNQMYLRADENIEGIQLGDGINFRGSSVAEPDWTNNDGSSTTQNSGHSGTVVKNMFFNPASEGDPARLPHIVNDLSGFTFWGTITTSGFYSTRSGSSGNFTYSNEITNTNGGWVNAFDGFSSTAGSWYSDNGADGTTAGVGTVELQWTNEATYGFWVGIVFGSNSFIATRVKIEAYQTDAGWQTLCDLTDNNEIVVLRKVKGNSGTGQGTTRIKYTLGGSTNNSYFRIHTLYAASYQAGNVNLSGQGLEKVRGIQYLQKYGNGQIWGHFRPAQDGVYDLGSSSLEWNNGYFDGTVYADGLSLSTNSFSASGTTYNFTTSFLRADQTDVFNGKLVYGGSDFSDAIDLSEGDLNNANELNAYEFKQRNTGEPRSNLGTPTVTEMALFEQQFKPQTTLANNYDDLTDLKFFIQETSSSSMTEVTSYSDDNKRKFLRTNNSSVIIPNGTYKFRVQFKAHNYTFVNALYGYFATQSHKTKVHVYKFNVASNSEINHTLSDTQISSWPGHLFLPMSQIPWHETNTTSTSHHRDVIIEFIPEWIPYSGSGTDYSDRDILLFGLQLWGGYPVGRRTPHSYDQNGKLDLFGDLGLKDNGKITLGDSDDLQIFHVGGNSYIDDAGTGDLRIRTTNGTAVKIQYGDEAMILANANSNVELYHNNSKKFETNSAGVTVSPTGAAGIQMGVDSSNSALSGRLFFENGTSGQGNTIFNNTGNLIFCTGATHGSSSGSEKIRLLANGNLGIGLTDPSDKLEVNGNILLSNVGDELRFANSNVAIERDNSHRLTLGGYGGIDFHAEGVTGGVASQAKRMRITSDGNVLIGVTSGSTAKLQSISANGNTSSLRIGRADNSNFWEFNHAGNDLRIYNQSSSGSHILLGVDPSGNAEANRVGINTAVPNYPLHVAGAAYFASPVHVGSVTNALVSGSGSLFLNNDKMVITSGGDVGIGQTSPAHKLDVAGYIRSANTGADSNTKYSQFLGRHYTNSEEDVLAISTESTSSNNNIYIGGGFSSRNSATTIRFSTAANNTTTTGTERMRLTASGNLGIGTSSPSEKLEVSGNAIITGTLDVGGDTTITNGLHVHSTEGVEIGDASSGSNKTTLTSIEGGGNSRMKIKGGNYIHSVRFETSRNDFQYADLNSSYNGSNTTLNLHKSNSDTTGTAATTTISTEASSLAGSLSVNGALTVGVDDTGYDVKFFGDDSGEFMQWDTSEAKLKIVHTDESVGLEVYTNAAAQTTQAQLKVGRAATQYWGVFTADRDAVLIHRQDEISGTMNTKFQHWDSNTSDTTGTWQWQHGDGSGSSLSTAMTLTQAGNLEITGDVSVAEKLIHSGDTDTFLQFGTNDIKLKTGGATHLHASSDQNTHLYSGNALALTLDGSQNATFAGNITFGDSHFIGDDSFDNLHILGSSGENVVIQAQGSTSIFLKNDSTSSLILDSSSNATFAGNISNSSGHFTVSSADDFVVDAVGNINLDADGGSIRLKDAGSTFGMLHNGNQDLQIWASTSNKDIIFKGYDDGTAFTALTLDMSDQGHALFNWGIKTGYGIEFENGNTEFLLYNNNNEDVLYMRDITNGAMITTWKTDRFQSDKDFVAMANATVAGNLTVDGNLTINGTTVTVDTTNLNVQDKNITLNYSTGDSSSTANGAGITIQDAVSSSTDATILWDTTGDKFDFSHGASFASNVTLPGFILDGNQIVGIDDSLEFTDDDNHIMTSAGIHDKYSFASFNTISGTFSYDDYSARGLYRFQGGTDGPAGGSHTTGIVVTENSGNYGFQLVTNGSGDNTEKLYYRYKSSTYENWQTIVTKTFADNRYLKLSGGTITGDLFLNGSGNYIYSDISDNSLKFADSANLKIGTGNDLQLFHNGTDSVIDNFGGDLYISQKAADKDIIFRADNGSGGFTTYLRIDGGDEIMKAGKNLRFNDSVRADFGTGSDFRIEHDGDHAYLANYTGDYYFEQKADGKDIIFTCDNGTGGTTTYFYLDGSIVENRFAKATRHSDSIIAKFGDGNDLNIYSDGTNGIISVETDDADLILKCDNGSGGTTAYITLDGSADNTKIHKDLRYQDNVKAKFGAVGDLEIYHDGSNSYITDSGTGDLLVSSFTLQGTGRIQGVDTVSVNTDAANKLYVDSKKESFVLACSDETTDLTASSSVAKVTFRMPYAFNLSAVRASVNTAPAGSAITVDIKKSGTTIFSTALTIDAGTKTSQGAGTPAVIANDSLSDDEEITVFCTAVGSSTAGKGLKVTLIGNQ